MRAIKTNRNVAKPVKSKRIPLSNEDHDQLAKSIKYIDNNLAVIRDQIVGRRVPRGVVSGLSAVQSALDRLNERLQVEYQVTNKPSGPYLDKSI